MIEHIYVVVCKNKKIQIVKKNLKKQSLFAANYVLNRCSVLCMFSLLIFNIRFIVIAEYIEVFLKGFIKKFDSFQIQRLLVLCEWMQ